MITTTDEISQILNEDPDVDVGVFWPRVGIDPSLMMAVIKAHAIMAGIPEDTAGALLETGATLAEAGIKRLNEGREDV